MWLSDRECTKDHSIVLAKMVNFMLFEFHFKKLLTYFFKNLGSDSRVHTLNDNFVAILPRMLQA